MQKYLGMLCKTWMSTLCRNCLQESLCLKHLRVRGTQVKIALSCKNLAVAETTGYLPPDPYAILFAADSRGNWEEVSRTETLQNSRGAALLQCGVSYLGPEHNCKSYASHLECPF